MAIRLRGCLREGDLVARLGGDEFLMVLLVPNNEALTQAQQVAERTLLALREPIDLGDNQVQIGCSIGGALWPLDSSNMAETLELADQSLYRAKHAGKNCAMFHAARPQ